MEADIQYSSILCLNCSTYISNTNYLSHQCYCERYIRMCFQCQMLYDIKDYVQNQGKHCENMTQKKQKARYYRKNQKQQQSCKILKQNNQYNNPIFCKMQTQWIQENRQYEEGMRYRVQHKNMEQKKYMQEQEEKIKNSKRQRNFNRQQFSCYNRLDDNTKYGPQRKIDVVTKRRKV